MTAEIFVAAEAAVFVFGFLMGRWFQESCHERSKQ
jgi:hypothetical protein